MQHSQSCLRAVTYQQLWSHENSHPIDTTTTRQLSNFSGDILGINEEEQSKEDIKYNA